MLFMQQDENLG